MLKNLVFIILKTYFVNDWLNHNLVKIPQTVKTIKIKILFISFSTYYNKILKNIKFIENLKFC